MRNISDEERRARLGRAHLLATPGADVVDVVRALVALHSSDPATVYLSAWARLPDFRVEDMEKALYEERALIRILGMRRTMFVVPTSAGPTVHCSSTIPLIKGQKKRAADLAELGGITSHGAAWVETVSEKTLAALKRRGTATAVELTEDVPELGERVEYRKKDGTLVGTFGMSTRILFVLAIEGRAIRGKPKGSWTSSMYTWAPLSDWTGVNLEGVDRDQAQSDLVDSWLRSYGPGTEADIKWWTGWSLAATRRALAGAGAAKVQTSAGPAYVASDDIEPVRTPEHWVALLPALDPTVMGWRQRDWYLSSHASPLFDRNGNPGPTVWVDGRIIGGWAQRKGGDVVFRLVEDPGSELRTAIEAKAFSLQSWLGDTVITPRFRTLIEKELAAS